MMASANSSHQYKRPESVLVVVYDTLKQVLLLRRKNPAHFWQSVAGSLDWSELAQVAATRELFEETGLSANNLVDCQMSNRHVIYPMWRERYAPGVIINTEYVFRIQVADACAITLDEQEHQEYQWTTHQQALNMLTSHTNRAAIKQWVV